MSEQPIPLETYRMLLEDEFELEEIIALSAQQSPIEKLLLEYARVLCDLGKQHAQILCALGDQIRQVAELMRQVD